MTTRTYTAPSPAGTAASPANTGFSLVNAHATGTIASDGTHVGAGPLALKVTPAASSSDSVVQNVSTSSAAMRLAVWMTAEATADDWVIVFYNAGTRLASFHLNAAGKLRLDNATGTTGVWTAANVLPLNQWVFINLYARAGTTGSDGELRGTYDLGDPGAPVEDSGKLTGQNVGTVGLFDTLRGGKVNSNAYATSFWIDPYSTVTDDAASDIIVPASNTAPTANAGPDQTVEPYADVTLDGTGSTDPDGTITTRAWVQTAGTIVALTGADTATPSFTAPATLTGDTLTFQLTVTDDDGATATDTVTVAVNRHTIWRKGSDGELHAVRWTKKT